MRHMTLLATAAALVLATPAFAQDAAPAAPAPQTAPSPPATPAEPLTPEQQAIEDQGNAFGQRMEAMSSELVAAITAAGTDTAKARADTDPIVARYQPDADTFATTLRTFVSSQGDTDEEKAQAAATAPQVESRIKGIPNEMREQALQTASSTTAAPAAAPTTPQ